MVVVEPGLEGPRGRQTDARIEERAGGGGGRAQISSGMTELPLPLWLCLTASVPVRATFQRPGGWWSREDRSFAAGGVGLDPVHGGGVAGNDDGGARPYPFGPSASLPVPLRQEASCRRRAGHSACGSHPGLRSRHARCGIVSLLPVVT